MRKGIFVDVAVSRMSKSGQRAFVNDGQVFRTPIALHASVTPIELTAGYRFRPKPRPLTKRHRITLIPYVGIGAGVYRYEETSDFSNPGDDVNESHLGLVALGGAEFRVSKWVGIAADVQYTRVPGILGQGGISKDSSESDLGGVAGRVRVILGR
jgi:outer membrane protein W